MNEWLHQLSRLSTAWLLPCSNDAFVFQMIFGDKIFMPHNFFDQFLGTEVCSRELLDRLCSNALFIMCGFDRQNLNVVCMHCDLHSRNSFQMLLTALSSLRHGISQELRVILQLCPQHYSRPQRNHKAHSNFISGSHSKPLAGMAFTFCDRRE